MGQCLGVQEAAQKHDGPAGTAVLPAHGSVILPAAHGAEAASSTTVVDPVDSGQLPQHRAPTLQQKQQHGEQQERQLQSTQGHQQQQQQQQEQQQQGQQQQYQQQQQGQQQQGQQQQQLQGDNAQQLPSKQQQSQNAQQAGSAEHTARSGTALATESSDPTPANSSQQLQSPGTSNQPSVATNGAPGQVQSDPSRLQSSTSGRRGTVELLRAQKSQRLRDRRSLTDSFKTLQLSVSSNVVPTAVHTRAAGLKHIGFGPLKRENQDEFFIQVEDFGGADDANLFCVFDGHGTYGKDAAAYSRQQLPVLLDAEMRKYFQKVSNPDEGLKGAVEVLLSEVFGETERSLQKAGININSSGTTASVAYQKGNRLWVASAGDSRVVLCSKDKDQAWRVQALTIDHRPRRPSERARVEASGGRVAPKRLPSGRTVGEPRLWLADVPSPGLLLSRSLGDMTAATVGCTSDPEITYLTLRPGIDLYVVLASDGVWDVLTNEQVCEIVVASPDPHTACRRVLDAALFEWEERMSADNITIIVAEFDWSGESRDTAHSRTPREQDAAQNGKGSHQLPDDGLDSDEEQGDALQPLRSIQQRRQLRGR